MAARLSAADVSTLDPYSRMQTGGVVRVFPKRTDGLCACGCERKLPPRCSRWATHECGEQAWIFYAVRAGNSQWIRSEIRKRDHCVCAECGRDCSEDRSGRAELEDETTRWRRNIRRKWQADHIIPVEEGGGACGLENFQTLCDGCHKVKTKEQAGRRAAERRAAKRAANGQGELPL